MKSVAEVTGGTGDSQYAFERRLRWMRIRIGIIAPLAAISLVVSHFVQPVPPPYLLAMFGLGIAVGALMIVSRGVNNIWWGFLLGGIFGGLIPYLEDLFPHEANGDFFAGLWQGMSASICGMTVIMVPLLRMLVRRIMPRVLEQQAAVSSYRRAGDSHFVAQCRYSAVQMGKGFIIVLIVMGSVMAGLGLFVWTTEGAIIGLVMPAMMLVPIGFFIWMLQLLRDGGTSPTST